MWVWYKECDEGTRNVTMVHKGRKNMNVQEMKQNFLYSSHISRTHLTFFVSWPIFEYFNVLIFFEHY